MDFSNMYFTGFFIGFISLIIIGVCHPLVVKMEYHYSKKSWKLLFLIGILFLGVSLVTSSFVSVVAGIIAFSLFWSCIELFKQHKRVLLGRAKKNPLRTYE